MKNKWTGRLFTARCIVGQIVVDTQAFAPQRLTVAVRILDLKEVSGQTRWLVTPIAGEGEVWVNTVTEVNKAGVSTF
jgi:hypothetical protein